MSPMLGGQERDKGRERQGGMDPKKAKDRMLVQGGILPVSSLQNTNPPECTDSSALQETSPARFRAVQV